MGRNQDPDPGSGMNNPDHISESLKNYFGLKCLNSLMWIRDPKNSDPGWKKFGSGIRDKHPGSATLNNRLRSEMEFLNGIFSRGFWA
jgi:hypothetical protein